LSVKKITLVDGHGRLYTILVYTIFVYYPSWEIRA